MKILKTATLGCKVNQYETEFVREAFLDAGYRDAQQGEQADLIVVNTCAVTAESEMKSRKMIRRLAKLHPNAEIIVMGCCATRDPEAVEKLPNVSEVITDKREINAFLERRGVENIPSGIRSFGERHRAYVKIQDGCRVGCAYCIIPKVRSYLLSRPVQDVLDEIKRLSDCGYREIVLTGIHLGHYGVDFHRNLTDFSEKIELLHENARLTDLLEKIIAIDAPFRIRISSLEAVEVTDAMIQLVCENLEKICPHFHLSMQSGSDTILKAMQRRYSSAQFLEKCEKIKSALEHVAMTTDVIVGFPGETEEDFEKTCQMAEKIGFSKIHVFPFSPRQGTIAETLTPQISTPVKADRAARLSKLEEKLRIDYQKTLIGTELQVLFESFDKNTLSGTSDRYQKVAIPGPKHLLGELVKVSITKTKGETLFGVLPRNE